MSGQAAIERTVTGMGYDLVDIERSAGGLLRVTIDRLPGRSYETGPSEFVTVEDCELVTRQLQYVLEVEAVGQPLSAHLVWLRDRGWHNNH